MKDYNFEPFNDENIRRVLKERNILLPEEQGDKSFKTIGDRVVLLENNNVPYYIVIEANRSQLLIVNPQTNEKKKINSNKVKLL
jgi:hypothetical protein